MQQFFFNKFNIKISSKLCNILSIQNNRRKISVLPPTITDLHKILITCIHLNDNIISYLPNPSFYILIVVHKLQDLSYSEEWKKLKIRQNCRKDVKKKGLTNVSSSQNIQCYHVFFKRTYQRTKQIVVFEGEGRGWGRVGYLSPWPIREKATE